MDVMTVLLGLLSILFACNAFFIKRLVDGIDKTNVVVGNLQIDMAVVKTHMGINSEIG